MSPSLHSLRLPVHWQSSVSVRSRSASQPEPGAVQSTAWRGGSVRSSSRMDNTALGHAQCAPTHHTALHCIQLHCTALHCTPQRPNLRCCTRRSVWLTKRKKRPFGRISGVSDGVDEQKYKQELTYTQKKLKFTYKRFVMLMLSGQKGEERKRKEKKQLASFTPVAPLSVSSVGLWSGWCALVLRACSRCGVCERCDIGVCRGRCP